MRFKRERSVTFGFDIEFFASKDGKVFYPPDNSKAGDIDGLAFELRGGANGGAVTSCRDSISTYIADFLAGTGHKYNFDSLHPGILANVPENATEKQLEVGCLPSMSVYDGVENVAQEMKSYPIRSAGGHIHVDFHPRFLFPVWQVSDYIKRDTPNTINVSESIETAIKKYEEKASQYRGNLLDKHKDVIKLMKETLEIVKGKEDEICGSQKTIELAVKLYDRTAGIASVALDVFPEENIERRRFYGRAGSYRLKPYGIEYRTPSNMDMLLPPIRYTMLQLIRLVNNALFLAQPSIQYAEHPYQKAALLFMEKLIKMASDDEIKECINFCLKDTAKVLLKEISNIVHDHTFDYTRNQLCKLKNITQIHDNKPKDMDKFGKALFKQECRYYGLSQIDLEKYKNVYFE